MHTTKTIVEINGDERDVLDKKIKFHFHLSKLMEKLEPLSLTCGTEAYAVIQTLPFFINTTNEGKLSTYRDILCTKDLTIDPKTVVIS